MALRVAHPQEAERAKGGGGGGGGALLPCLVVCPSTLVQHWVHEIHRFLDRAVMRPVAILGNPAERAAAQRRFDAQWAAAVAATPSGGVTVKKEGGGGAAEELGAANVVVMSYEHLKVSRP